MTEAFDRFLDSIADDELLEPDIVETMLAHVGRMNVLAISGGRVNRLDEFTVSLPVHYGYSVEVHYDRGWDLYTVRRVFTRGGKRTVKGEVERLYFDNVGEAAYRASCFRDPFGDHNP
jgi:hypothetical protein